VAAVGSLHPYKINCHAAVTATPPVTLPSWPPGGWREFTAMARFKHNVVISRPVGRVFAFV
jgi:hypothetical protein